MTYVEKKVVSDRLIITNYYELHDSADAFADAVTALVARVESEGHQGIRSYRFYVNIAENCARGIIEYEDAGAWVGHHDAAMGWPEMMALHTVSNLSRVIFYGPVNQAVLDWIANSNLAAQLSLGNDLVAGFER